MASFKTLIFLFVAVFAVAFAAEEEARDKRGVFYGGYGAYPYSAGYHSAAYPYSAGYGLGYSGYSGYSAYPYSHGGYHGYPYSYYH